LSDEEALMDSGGFRVFVWLMGVLAVFSDGGEGL
jgi:hypothetical protein